LVGGHGELGSAVEVGRKSPRDNAFGDRVAGAKLDHEGVFEPGNAALQDDRAAGELLKEFCAVLRKQAEVRKWPCAYAYAHERTRDEGLHTHLLTTWPRIDAIRFEKWAQRYFAKRAGRHTPDRRAVKVVHRGDGDVKRHWFWFGYLTKGVHPGVRLRYGDDSKPHWVSELMLRRHADGGVVRCRKRVGLSRNLDSEAQRSFGAGGFVSVLHTPAGSKRALYTDAYLREYEADQRRDETLRLLPSGDFTLL